ncbi:uncharacterized protein TRIADDRAFT_53583 [Trichoplax adhaerens]|uniref:BRCT domain-containing protein n=1 Tax=Trichoplax adhaerens TaxID=10228 RepID=B3RPL5_TRIAD|nr:hypothetical protein TRIADDRAFT_53583 [Trichoplax adhaerens]EDV27656.1 hypothetical protein TRIADDRAFT_53583 [Trichoplax adhaerens]|eukprot:XP_002109490.1 hypothetical protein TRIADDRAFT_53583 [Trichoplax adhaerens]
MISILSWGVYFNEALLIVNCLFLLLDEMPGYHPSNHLELVCGDTTRLTKLRKLEKLVKRQGYVVHWTKLEEVHKKKFESDVTYVLDPFSGQYFEHLKQIGARIVGPQCLEHSITKKEPLLDSPYPVFNFVMKDLVICCTNLSKDDRDELHSLIKMMGGKVNPHLTTDVTHLVAGENKHLCPIFSGCTICVTGLDKEERGNIDKLITVNGGSYSPELDQRCTHLLVNVPKGDKYEYALQWNIHCVLTKWFYDSLKAKGALSENKYICVNKSSKSNEHAKSREVAHSSTNRQSQIRSLEEIKKSESRETKLDITIPEHSSFFLDGCKILLSGFNEIQQSQLQSVINSGGGTRFNTLEDSVTHVVISEDSLWNPTDLKALKSQPFVVSVRWLIDSSKNGIKLPEDDYLVNAKAERNSSTSLQPSRKRKNVGLSLAESDYGDVTEIINQYVPVDDSKKAPSELFCGKKLYICGFTEAHITQLQLIIETNGGQVLTNSLQADMIITPPCIYESEDENSSLRNLPCVTTYYLEDCLEVKQLKDISESVFYKPFYLPAGVNPLKDCVLSISQFSGSLRNYLIELIRFVGGRFQEQLVRLPQGKLYPSTHLLLIKPSGSKYGAAKKWKIPTVSEKWLIASCEAAERAVENQYIVDEFVSSVKSTENTTTMDTVQPVPDTTERLKPVETSVPDAVRSLVIDPVEDNCEEPTIANSDNKKELTDDDKENGNPVEVFESESTVLKGVTISASKKLSSSHRQFEREASQLGADWRWTFEDCCTHFIYQVADVTLTRVQIDNDKCITPLPNLFEKGKATENNRELKAAKKAKAILVSPSWLKACLTEKRRLEESSYPITYNPKLNLDEPVRKRRRTRRSLNPESNQVEKFLDDSGLDPEIDKNDNTGFDNSVGHISEIENEDNREGTLESREDFKRHVDELIEVTSVENSRLPSLSTFPRFEYGNILCNYSYAYAASSLGTPDSKDIPTSGEASKTNQTTHRITRKMAQNLANKITAGEPASASLESTSDYSQTEAITYDDPAGRQERERIKARLRRNRSGEKTDSERDDLNETCDSKDRVKINTGRQSPASFGVHLSNTNLKVLSMGVDEAEGICSPSPAKVQYRFLLSAMKPQEKINYAGIVENLEGVFYDTQYFTQACTHVVVGDINRNEKCLAAMASGKWLLRKSFLDESQLAGRFVSEEEHEWGSDHANNSSLSKLSIAARRWRKKVQEENRNRKLQGIIGDPYGAFKGWKVLLSVDVTRQSGFKRLLEAGCATVMKLKPPFPNIEGVTHAFIDTNRTKPGSIDLQQLINANIVCLKPDYIAEYLTHDPPPNPDSFILSEVQNLMKS